MKKLLTLFLIGILFTSCSNDDDNGIDCSLFDPAFPELYIRLVDETGANLIENGTFDPEYIRKYDNTIYLFIPNESNFEYTINLDNSTSIILNLEARFAELPCGVSYFIPTKLTYNDQNVESENAETDELIFLAEIEI